MCSTISQRDDMMHFLRWGQPTVLLALGTERVGFYERRTDFYPIAAIPLSCFRITLVKLIVLGVNFGMLITKSLRC